MSEPQPKAKLSDNERLKGESNFLRGTIVQDLQECITGGFNWDNYQLLRFHGMYQQDDRDLRAERADQKLEPLINMMLRCRLPGGVMTPQQWLNIDLFAAAHTLYGSIRLTTRQTFQFHGVLKKNLQSMHKLLHRIGLDSIATAGDVNRNVLCTSNPFESVLHKNAWEWAKQISEHLLPKTRAYAEIWLNGEKTETTDNEPILGYTYLPRKFKTTVVVPPLNDVDLHANDLNFVAISNNGKLVGFNVLVGGGLAMTHGDKSTYPRKASEFGYIALADTLKIAEAVVTTQRDLGNRYDRKNAKTKYTLERVGISSFKEEVENRAGVKFASIQPYHFTSRGDRFGWVKGIDNKWHLTLFIENGRIIDSKYHMLKTGMAKIASIHKGDLRITANQNMIIAGVDDKDKTAIESLARQHGMINNNVTVQRRASMACVAFPTCPLAMAEAERFIPQLVTKVEKIMSVYGLGEEEIILRVTGCPNGCGRAMLAEIGLVGKAIGRYNLYLGGERTGTRIPRMYRENITEEEILSIIYETVGRWASERKPQESYGDYVVRAGIIRPVLDSARDFYD